MDLNTHHLGGWETTSQNIPQSADDAGLHVKLMGLKVQYTFDTDSQERCLARWPELLYVRTYPIDDQTRIGIVELKTCLQAITQCSPELLSDNEKDYTVYVYDYSEPDIPLVGQGMLSWAFGQEPNSNQVPSLVTGRISRNPLAIVSNGIRDTLEVKFKLTLVAKPTRANTSQLQRINSETSLIRRTATPTPSETSEWHSFSQYNMNPNQPSDAPVGITSMATAPIQPSQPNHQARPSSQGLLPMSERRTASIEPNPREHSRSFAMGIPDAPVIAPAPVKGGKAPSRPASRASSKPPSGRPRGRPRKKPLQTEGSTSGIEDATDADDGPPRSKKRATTTRVERNNTATFSAMPDSLRVAASTAGSIRNIRPVSIAGDARAGNHVQEAPRAPTPVPRSRFPNLPQARPTASSSLRRESIPGTGMDMFAMACGQNARSPTESAGVSPSQMYSDEASPADIGSSPPVPRSSLFSTRSSPAPSSPILPPMPSARAQPDSGFMSGGLDSRVDEDTANRAAADMLLKVPMMAKPKARRSRAKKTPAMGQSDLVIHTETPGPPELLPQKSLYNPPHLIRKNSETAKTPLAARPTLPAFPEEPSERTESEMVEKQSVEKAAPTEEDTAQENVANLETTTPMDLADDQSQQQPESFDYDGQRSGMPAVVASGNGVPPTMEPVTTAANLMDRPTGTESSRVTPVEPELPMVPASDPVRPQSMLTMPLSEPAHPQTDAMDPADGKSNKNVVKRLTIKQKLEEAIAKGQLPSFCNNCGAIQTPTWRKIWKQVQAGVPAYHEYSEKPGCVTAITILSRDASDHPTSYEIIKKSLGPTDKKSAWTEVLLCNPCGIWFSKFKQHRPADKWEKDSERLSQTRKKRPNGGGQSRSKKARTKSDTQTNLTSEACLPTDPLGPLDGPTPLEDMAMVPASQAQHQGEKAEETNRQGSTHSRASSHSRGSGTFNSPIAVDDDLGATRRVLFPSPRKEGEQRVLGEVAVNIVQTSPESLGTKGESGIEKENNLEAELREIFTEKEYADIFGTPPRPSTPPPNANSGGPFKTPTRATPGHRPVTRSVTRSMRSVGSPSQMLMIREQTPTRTPRSGVAKRHSPGDLMPSHLFEFEQIEQIELFDTPLSADFDHYSDDDQDLPNRGYQTELDAIFMSQPMNFDPLFGPIGGGPPPPPKPRKLFPHKSDEENRRIATYFAMMEAGSIDIPDVEKGKPAD
ncbi:uncharacterized protein F4807DRAFT_20574 [Annulohypoxylon truncatum]|uniref:uncharacterized protein n=1 Tax=Annulohypoxylon truncatum TaxID=327061 RepID=UPI002008B579|nr:uncharacterized protein F4807DRAFT_20574 [Annulohypoxylon truncatum]KAI1215095.1 hypothetical protein F4807DRAFT_20574 [Annulohypoxylon truncatum]